MSPAPFDAVAKRYDQEFTHSRLGRELRERVWKRLAVHFPPGSRVLELGCGTGEDATWLAASGVSVVATDQSPAMLEVARKKTRGSVELAHLDLTCPEADFLNGTFDGAFSNFGGLNCVEDLQPLARSLARWLRPGAPVVLVVMSPLCLWEILWNLARLDPRTAFRRWKRGGSEARIEGHPLQVFYPRPSRLAEAFEPELHLVQWRGLGVALPPSSLAAAMERHQGLFRFLRRLENWTSQLKPFSFLGDHTILELQKGSP